MLDPSILVTSGQAYVTGGVAGGTSAAEVDAAMRRAEQAESHTRMMAAALEIQAALDSTDDLQDAATCMTRLLREALNAKRVMVAWRSNHSNACRIVADSDESSASDAGKTNRFAESAAEEITARGSLTVWPPTETANRHALMAVSQFAESVGADSLAAAAISGTDKRVRGALIVIEPTTDAGQFNTLPFLDVIREGIGHKLAAIERLQPNRWEQKVRALTSAVTGSKRKLILAIPAALIVLMLLPVPYHVRTSCELQPIGRRYVAVPFDGPLASALVRPGDIVEQGQTLARINPREIDYELAGVHADLNRAKQERNGLLAEHDFGGSKIAGFESERLRLQAELLAYRRENVEIRSPLAGIVVSGDHKKSEGTPLTRGEMLFEIAPLGEMVVEVFIPETDIALVESGMPVQFRLHATPNRLLKGKLARVHPRAELKEHENVFVGEVHVTDPDNVLRPGMRGHAWVRSGRRPLGWNLFHKAFYSLRSAVGW